MIKSKEYKVMDQVQKNITPRICMRVHVPPAAVLEAQQVLDAMPNILKLTHVNELLGWLEMELVPGVNHSWVNPYQVNRILSALIRAKVPIISFAPKHSLSENMVLNFSTDANK